MTWEKCKERPASELWSVATVTFTTLPIRDGTDFSRRRVHRRVCLPDSLFCSRSSTWSFVSFVKRLGILPAKRDREMPFKKEQKLKHVSVNAKLRLRGGKTPMMRDFRSKQKELRVMHDMGKTTSVKGRHFHTQKVNSSISATDISYDQVMGSLRRLQVILHS